MTCSSTYGNFPILNYLCNRQRHKQLKGTIFMQARSHVLRGPELVPATVHVSFVVDEVALGQVFLRLLEFT
jgi:hypothetical protein